MLELDTCCKAYKVGAFGARRAARRPRRLASRVAPGRGRLADRRERQRQVDDREDDPPPRCGRRAGTITFDGVDISTLEGRALKALLRRRAGRLPGPVQLVQPDLQGRPRLRDDPQRSTSPGTSSAEWHAKLERVARGRQPRTRGDVLDKYPHQLSGGQLQRMLIARALLLDIRLLVADEIISMLDASTRIDVLNLLGDLKARGLGILFITHDLSLGNYISDRTMIMRRGAVVEMGATERVFGNPLHPYTRTLLASVPQLHSEVGATPSRRRRRDRRRRGAGSGSSRSRTTTSSRWSASRGGRRHDEPRRERCPAARRRDPVGGAPARVERRRLALEPQPDHPARPHPAGEQHLQLRGRPVPRRLRGRLPRRRHAPRDEHPRRPQRRRRRLGDRRRSRSRSSRATRAWREIRGAVRARLRPARVPGSRTATTSRGATATTGPTIGVG